MACNHEWVEHEVHEWEYTESYKDCTVIYLCDCGKRKWVAERRKTKLADFQ